MNENGIGSLSFDFESKKKNYYALEWIWSAFWRQHTNGHSKDGQIKTHAHEIIHKSDALEWLKMQQIVYYYVLFYLALAFFSSSLSSSFTG